MVFDDNICKYPCSSAKPYFNLDNKLCVEQCEPSQISGMDSVYEILTCKLPITEDDRDEMNQFNDFRDSTG